MDAVLVDRVALQILLTLAADHPWVKAGVAGPCCLGSDDCLHSEDCRGDPEPPCDPLASDATNVHRAFGLVRSAIEASAPAAWAVRGPIERPKPRGTPLRCCHCTSTGVRWDATFEAYQCSGCRRLQLLSPDRKEYVPVKNPSCAWCARPVSPISRQDRAVRMEATRSRRGGLYHSGCVLAEDAAIQKAGVPS